MNETTAAQQVEQLLLHYQQMAMRTLGGPASQWNRQKNLPVGLRVPPQLPVPPVPHAFNRFQKKAPAQLPYDFTFNLPFPSPPTLPILIPQDPGSLEENKVSFTDLEGRSVPSFSIGGEPRICLRPVLSCILNAVDLDVTDEACDSLQIYFSKCTPVQLQLLKQLNVLPPHIVNTGLIRKSDAERLCTLLLHSNLAEIIDINERNYPQINDTCFPVYHECFGEGHGFFYTSLYTDSNAKCISCADCERLFSPDRFITHSHYNQERRVCHWGFDRNNWRHYLLLSEDEIDDDILELVAKSYEKVLDKYKGNDRRRKLSDGCSSVPAAVDSDGGRTSEPPTTTTLAGSQTTKRRCLRAPMRASCYDDNGKPMLEDPDRVISHEETHLYEKGFVPNVSLKPTPTEERLNVAAKTEDGVERDEDNNVLDLSSPRSKMTSEPSSASAAETTGLESGPPALVGKETEEQSSSALELEDEEFVDVTSPDDTEQESKEDNSSKGPEACGSALAAMEELFQEALIKSAQSSESKDKMRCEFMQLCATLRGSLQ